MPLPNPKFQLPNSNSFLTGLDETPTEIRRGRHGGSTETTTEAIPEAPHLDCDPAFRSLSFDGLFMTSIRPSSVDFAYDVR